MTTTIISIKERALSEYAEVQRKAAEDNAENAKNWRERGIEDLREALERRLGITDGVEFDVPEYSGGKPIHARLTTLPGIVFYLSFERPVQLVAAAVLPATPATPEYEAWDENPANNAITRLRRTIDFSHHGGNPWADLGALLKAIDDHSPLEIKPWPKEEPEPAEVKPEPETAVKVGPTYDFVEDADKLIKRLNAGWSFVAVLQQGNANFYPRYLICQ